MTLRFVWVFTATLILCIATNIKPNSHSITFNSAQAQTEPITANPEADRLLQIGVEQAKRRELQEAVDMFRRVLALSQYNRDRERQEIALNNLAVVYRTSGQPDRSVQFYQQAFDIFRNPDILVRMAEYQLQLQQRLKALESYQKAFAIYRQSNNSDRETETLLSIADLYVQLGDFSPGLQAYREALATYRRKQNCQNEDATLQRMGQVYERIGQNNLARQLYQQVARQQADRNRQCAMRVRRQSLPVSPIILGDDDISPPSPPPPSEQNPLPAPILEEIGKR
ncbi:tetratricopeptide repeat protein [Aerosakkonema funiforme]|uniref:Tetratricopeptide repeat protein n=1 Tax=Aerosakkonema funiforme FACHB-1375 TaxID=2949571 RepID=A0A926VK73_9CYAN|nr:tetratricopeptide repeat protein [Aerosakkonema funiforme]MBD2185402.1 tetratricopeptide repeat protein [Aerosakkonema funiforme FACHB-1375]